MSPWQPSLPYNALLCRYNEIGIKGRNRARFEEQLADGLQRSLAPIGPLRVIFEHGRIILLPKEGREPLDAAGLALLRERVPGIAGVSSISPCFLVNPTLTAIEEAIESSFPAVCEAFLAQEPPPVPSYAMRARRSDKRFPMDCQQLEKHFAGKILPRYPQLHLDLKNANFVVEVEIRRQQAFVSYERIEGPGGLPAGSSGRVLALLSGGIDSPVACFQMMRRGCMVDYITFHSEPYTPPAYITKLCGIAHKLNDYQRRGRLVTVNLLPAQLAIRDHCRSRHRTVLYRRFMLHIASIVARAFNAEALVTGDNIGQVASQTLSNMAVINAATDMMVLRPLLTFDKLEITNIAQRIGTYALSIEDIPDSCTVFAPDAPATATELARIREDEQNIDVDALVAECLKQTFIVNPRSFAQHPFGECENN
jgi:thiamine biosynthesis protein ThiI